MKLKKNLLLWNYRANFNQTLLKWSLSVAKTENTIAAESWSIEHCRWIVSGHQRHLGKSHCGLHSRTLSLDSKRLRKVLKVKGEMTKYWRWREKLQSIEGEGRNDKVLSTFFINVLVFYWCKTWCLNAAILDFAVLKSNNFKKHVRLTNLCHA